MEFKQWKNFNIQLREDYQRKWKISLCLSSLLDPRFKMQCQREYMMDKIKEWTLEVIKDADSLESETNSASLEDDQETGCVPLTLSNLFDELAYGKRDNIGQQGSLKKKVKSITLTYDKELQEYLN